MSRDTSKARIISLLTDFGSADGYVGIVKAVILGICPAASLVDLTHEVERYDIAGAAWVLANAWRYFPAGSIHLAVVDPGVGSARRPLLLRGENGWFVGPDNGIFSRVLEGGGNWKAYVLTAESRWLEPVSATFHARDIYAPVAAYLASGVEADSLGTAVELGSLVRLPLPRLAETGHRCTGEIVHVDRFGNLISNIPERCIPVSAVCFVGKVPLGRVRHTYSSVGAGEAAAVVGSHGFLEIGVNLGSAREKLGAGAGTEVSVESQP